MNQEKVLKFKVTLATPGSDETQYELVKAKESYLDFVNEIRQTCADFFKDNPKKKVKFVFVEPKNDCLSFYDDTSYEEALKVYANETKSIKLRIEEKAKKTKKETNQQESTTIENIKMVSSLSSYLQQKLQNQINQIKNELDLTKNIFIIKQKTYENLSTQNIIHDKIICQHCLTQNIKGIRYLCAECNNYNLCDKCEKQKQHNHPPDHLFLKITNPIDISNNIEYSCMFPNNNLLLNFTIIPKLKNLYKLKIKIKNTGTNDDWNGCILCPIGYGKDFLNGNKVVIKQNVSKYIEKDIEIFAEKKGIYVTKWRMFTKEGIPFGDVFKCPVKVDSI